MKNLIPNFVKVAYRRLRLKLIRYKNKNKETEKIFEEIYLKNSWGGNVGEFCSGNGTYDACAEMYVNKIIEMLKQKNSIVLDIGCGDFHIGSKIAPYSKLYIGTDIVRPVIEKNTRKYSSTQVKFLHLNAITDTLPDADTVLVRQVLQHLSNESILKILPKLKKYKQIIITEHYPISSTRYNLDKTTGEDIRLYDDSGVYLDKPPFDKFVESVDLIFECVPDDNWGIIRTFSVKMKN
jgi:SAM-dependent methyltransferase